MKLDVSSLAHTKMCIRDRVDLVCAPAQAARAERMLPLLTEEELAFYKRGRNAHVHQVPKNATYAQYARATGLEMCIRDRPCSSTLSPILMSARSMPSIAEAIGSARQ